MIYHRRYWMLRKKNIPNSYLWITDRGHIFSYGGRFVGKKKVSINDKGYPYITWHWNGRSHKRPVHRILAELFLPNPNNHTIVRHLDDNKLNNALSNLSWGTYKDNSDDKFRNGYIPNNRKLSISEISTIISQYKYGLSSLEIGRRHKVSRRTIERILQNKTYVSARPPLYPKDRGPLKTRTIRRVNNLLQLGWGPTRIAHLLNIHYKTVIRIRKRIDAKT